MNLSKKITKKNSRGGFCVYGKTGLVFLTLSSWVTLQLIFISLSFFFFGVAAAGQQLVAQLSKDKSDILRSIRVDG